MRSFVSLLTIGDDQLLIQSLSSSNQLLVEKVHPRVMGNMDLWRLCGLMSVVYSEVCNYFFVIFIFVSDDADSCQYQQVAEVMKTHSSLHRALSIERGIDWCGDVEGIEQQEAVGVGGCAGPSGFISPAGCQRPSDSAGNQWGL